MAVLSQSLPAQSLGLYVSVPFCRAKCSFCNFASGVGSEAAIRKYLALLCAEIHAIRQAAAAHGAALPESVDTVYFGGGTPSLLAPEQLRAIFAALRDNFQMDPEAEVTLEAAPGQIGDGLLDAALRCGVNRVSLGVQSFVDREAMAVGRSHTEKSCRAEFARLRAAGVHNLGIDLIAGLPYQTEASWQATLDITAASPLDHLSVYMFEVDEESRLGREVLSGSARLHAPAVPDEEQATVLYEQAGEQLVALGYDHYEISNFGRAGYRSRHNQRYWRRQPYLGFGLDAHSMLAGDGGIALRWANASELACYNGHPGIGVATWGTIRETFEETVFLGLRLTEGLPKQHLHGFPKGWREEFTEAARMLVEENLLAETAHSYRLTAQGRLVSNEVFAELLRGAAS